jgi:hypothetical protein
MGVLIIVNRGLFVGMKKEINILRGDAWGDVWGEYA